MKAYILAIDLGTSSTRAIIFNQQGQRCGVGQYEFPSYHPYDGWVEQDAEEIWQTTLRSCHQALKSAEITASQVATIGITNQRETCVLWNKKTDCVLHRAIVWQDRRTADHCKKLKAAGLSDQVQQKTGLLLDPYFSATKVAYMLDQIPDAQALINSGDLAFGTLDSFLLWRLSGSVHKTEPSNASRTLLYNIHEQRWDPDLLDIFKIPASILPEVVDSNAEFAMCDTKHFGCEIPITGILGDQQAATLGQACIHPGMMKSTYGTGCFVLMNTGDQIIRSQHQLLSTIVYRINGICCYGLEGSIFNAGTTIKWLRDKLGVIQSAKETQALAEKIENTGSVYLVPAFTGLGAPHWAPHARAAIVGLSPASGIAEIVRAGLESVCYQSKDLLDCLEQESQTKQPVVRVDGGMAVNDWLMQFLADILAITVERPCVTETTALGAAFIAGLGAGIYTSLDSVEAIWQCQSQFQPNLSTSQRDQYYQGWQRALKSVLR